MMKYGTAGKAYRIPTTTAKPLPTTITEAPLPADFWPGILGGLIGWGIGYAVVSSQVATVPPRYVSRMKADERLQFSAGYKDKIKSKRKSTFNKGALTGTLILVALVLVSYDSQ